MSLEGPVVKYSAWDIVHDIIVLFVYLSKGFLSACVFVRRELADYNRKAMVKILGIRMR